MPRIDGTRGPSPIVTVLAGSTAAAVLVALMNVGTLAATVDVVRVRDLDLFRAMRLLLEAADLNLLAHAPAVLSWPFDLGAPRALCVFTALAITTALLLFWAVAAASALPMLAFARSFHGSVQHRFADWMWHRAYPLGSLAGFSTPAIMVVARHLIPGASRAGTLAAALVLAAALSIILLFTLRDMGRTRQFLRASCLSSLVAAALAWSAAGLAVALARVPVQPPALAGLPNVLLVSIDSLRRDHLHCYGYARETSPTIDRLAREGALFRTVASPTSWTLPAHLTLLTSLPPETHGVVDDGMRLRDDAIFLAEVLWGAGYVTAGFVSAPYLDAAYGFSQGFDHYDDYTIARMSQRRAHHGSGSPALLALVSRWLDDWHAAGRQRPFFVFMHMWDVHYDYTPPPPYGSMFDPDYTGAVTGDDYEYGTQVHAGMDQRDLEHIIALYDGEIRFTDLHLGALLNRLSALHVLDDTIVVVTADHGDEFFEHGRKGHGKALYDETILVPLVIRFPPSVPQGKVIDGQVRLMDVAPTIISLAGLAQPPAFGSLGQKHPNVAQALTPRLFGDANPPALVAFGDLQVADAPAAIASVRTAALKFISPLRSAAGGELYYLAKDPGEQENTLGRLDRLTAASLRRQLWSWRQAQNGSDRLSQKVALSEEDKERLRQLGYMK